MEKSLLALIQSDVRRFAGDRSGPVGLLELLHMCYDEESLLAVMSFRVVQAVSKIENRLLRTAAKFCYSYTIHKALSLVLDIRIDARAQIGEGLYVAHRGCVYIGNCRIGRNCNISQETTIGFGGREGVRAGRPTIGDCVYIGPGAKLFGAITIGNNVSIGANAVVSRDVPDNAVVMGNPGRVVGYQEQNPMIQSRADAEAL